MKYLLQVYLQQTWWEAQPPHARMAFAEACQDRIATLTTRGQLHAAHTLDQLATTLVEMHAGDICVCDGPFPATQDYLIEHYLIDARDLNHAIAVAAQMPQLQGGVIEVVPLREYP